MIMAACIAATLAGCSGSTDSGVITSNDANPPYINIKNYEYTTTIGKPIDFSNITGYDDVDGLLATEVKGFINYDSAGDYYPSITCTDLSGNESSVAITVHVVAAVDPTPPQPPQETPGASAQATGCTATNAQDPSLACDVVPSSALQGYQTIYQGEEGKAKCEASAAANSGSCTVILQNDGQVWGYGYASAPVPEDAVVGKQ
jgi:hypothetical protein